MKSLSFLLHSEYLSRNLPPNSKVGMDSTLITADDALTISSDLSKVGSSLIPLQQNLIDQVWGNSRPSMPSNKIFVQQEKHSGQSYQSKISDLRDELKKKTKINGGNKIAKGYVSSMLDETAWLFNLRGSDVPYNPVFFAFALVTLDRVLLYVDEKKLDDQSRAALGGDVEIKGYHEFYDDLKKIGGELKDDEKVSFEPTSPSPSPTSFYSTFPFPSTFPSIQLH